MDNQNYCILVVDDEPEMREMIADYLSDVEGYQVHTAENGRDALDRALKSRRTDLVLSDINMPEMKGFELLNEVRSRYPEMKRVLITAYNVEDYLGLALKYDVGNIFVKTTPFNFSELSTALSNLLTNNIFGADRFFAPQSRKKVIQVKHARNLVAEAREAIRDLPESVTSKKLELVIVELLTNAIYYGVRRESPEDKSVWQHDFELSSEEAIVLSVVMDDEKYAVSVTDNGGHLTKQDILYWLNRQSNKDKSGLPEGIFDTHGRGLFIARKYIDRLIINIDPAKKTEVIIINYLSNVYQGYKPLYINEL